MSPRLHEFRNAVAAYASQMEHTLDASTASFSGTKTELEKVMLYSKTIELKLIQLDTQCTAIVQLEQESGANFKKKHAAWEKLQNTIDTTYRSLRQIEQVYGMRVPEDEIAALRETVARVHTAVHALSHRIDIDEGIDVTRTEPSQLTNARIRNYKLAVSSFCETAKSMLQLSIVEPNQKKCVAQEEAGLLCGEPKIPALGSYPEKMTARIDALRKHVFGEFTPEMAQDVLRDAKNVARMLREGRAVYVGEPSSAMHRLEKDVTKIEVMANAAQGIRSGGTARA